MARKKRGIFLGPILVILIMIVLIALCSWIFSLLGISGQQTIISGGEIKTTLVPVNNLISRQGIKYIFSNVVINFQLFEPLFLLLISLIGISIGEASGLFKAIFAPFRRIKLSIIIMITLLVGIIGNIFGPSAYALLLPLTGIFYKYIGRNPMLGIITSFLALTIGQGAGFILNNDEYALGQLTQTAAQLSVDESFVYSMFSNIYITISGFFILVFIGHFVITKYIAPKLSKWELSEEEKVEQDLLNTSSNALKLSIFAFVLIMLFVIYMIIPNLPGSGILLATEGTSYLSRLFGADSAFTSSISFIIALSLMICGGIYGFVSKNIKNIYEYNNALEKSFTSISYALVLFFFVAQLIGILNYTNINTILATKLIDLISSLSMTGLPLIITFFFIAIIITILIPTITAKWLIMAPVVVPLMMRANITPNLAQYTFIVADGVGKSLTPVFGYFILMIALLQKYNQNYDNKITIFGTLRKIWPAIVLFVVIWLLIISGWYVIGIPLGINTATTL